MLFSKRRWAASASLLVSLSALIAVPVHAQQKITIGTSAFPGPGDNAFPFGTDTAGNFPDYAAGGEFQEIYPSAAFGLSAPVNIDSIAFASSGRYSSPATATYDVTIGLSNTTVSSPDFAANKGANFTTVFNGTLTTTLQGNNTFDLVFPTTTPFTFDPANGNLLFDVVLDKVTTATGSEVFLINYPGQTQRVFQSFGQGPPDTDGEGLYTQFTVTPTVPEESTFIGFASLLALGLGAVVLSVKTRKRQTASE